nr:reverse transcriptase domain-containing protein [Tanacetum cinerariifolium]
NDAIKLMLFPYSLEDRARIWYENEPPNSILTWEDLVNKFINQFFPPSKTTHLKNEISRFTQQFDETFSKDWDRFKELLRACPHHSFLELTQIDTFYNGLTEQDQDSLNAVSGGNLLNKTTREALQIIENKSKVRYSISKTNIARVNTNSRDIISKTDDRIDKLADQISNLVDIVNKQVVAPAKAVEKVCVTCGGAHAYYGCIANDSNHSSICATTGSYNQVSPPNRASHQIPPPGFASVQNNLNRDVPNDVIKLMMFSYSLEGNARVWYHKEPPNSILTWEDLVNKFVNQFFPPSKTTHLKSEISRFTQIFEETFGEVWERFKEMLRACPHHGFTELAQIDTFYNGLNDNDQDSLNAAAGGNLLIDIFAKKVVTPAPVKAVEESCVTYGGAHAYYNCPNTNSNQPSVCVATGTYNQVAPQNCASNYMAPLGFAP